MIRISACVIVKNEEKNMARWLDCMAKLADEIIVVDTGSTDSTAAIAKAAGARCFFFPWRDDFSAAKNFALEQAHGDWIVFPDADEYFPPEAIPQVQAYIQRYRMDYRVAGFYSRMKEFDKDTGRLAKENGQLRVFRNLKNMRYAGRVHEALQVPANKRVQYAPEMVIYHTGYTDQLLPGKIRRNLALLQAEAKETGRISPERYIYFMDCYFGLDDYANAEKYARLAIDSGQEQIGMEGRAYTVLVTVLLKQGRSPEEAAAVLQAGMKAYPALPGMYLMQGILYGDQKDYLAAERYLRRGIQLREQPPQDALPVYADNTPGLLPYAYLRLGQLARRKGRAVEAAEFFIKGLRLQPDMAELFFGLYSSISGLPAADRIQLLNSIYDKQQAAWMLAGWLASLRLDEVYLYYARLAGQREAALAAGYLAAGRYEAAAVKLAAELDGLYRLGIASARLQGRIPGPELVGLLPEEYQRAAAPGQTDNGLSSCLERLQDALSTAGGK